MTAHLSVQRWAGQRAGQKVSLKAHQWAGQTAELMDTLKVLRLVLQRVQKDLPMAPLWDALKARMKVGKRAALKARRMAGQTVARTDARLVPLSASMTALLWANLTAQLPHSARNSARR